MTSSSGSQTQVPTAAQDLSLVPSTIARLRAEHDAASESKTRAILLHEIGVLEERIGEETESVRSQLAAVNAEADFREPLERLIAIIERRQSYKNLGRLLERLVGVADDPEERTRALLDQSFYLLHHEDDAARARTLLESAALESPNDASVWLALELSAAKLEDVELRTRALAARAALSEHQEWRALLLRSLAEERASALDYVGAEEALEQTIALGTAETYSSVQLLAEFAKKKSEPSSVLRAQQRLAETLSVAVDDPARADALGIPLHLRSAAAAAHAWLEASESAREQGRATEAIAFIERAEHLQPGDPLLSKVRWQLAESENDAATLARLARKELVSGANGPRAAALELRIAEDQAGRGETAAALNSVTRALEHDASSLGARALQLDLLGSGDDPQAFASALEAAAELLPTDRAKARFYLLSADVWARSCGDTQGARAALSQAGMYGAAPAVVARVARFLAALADDSAWYEEATRRLIAQGATEDELADLWFELARARALRGERAGAAQAMNGLAAAPGGAWLGSALSAYALELLPEPGATGEARASTTQAAVGMEALRALAAAENDPERARALRVLLAWRALLQGDAATARDGFERLHRAAPGDLVATSAFTDLERRHGTKATVAAALARSAAEVDDAELSQAFELEAGMLCWQGGARAEAIAHFGRASERGAAAEALLDWALAGEGTGDIARRRHALDVAAERAPDLAALDRFALESTSGGDVDRAREELSSLLSEPEGELYPAALLARALWSPGGNEEDERARALEQLADQPGTAALARAQSYSILLSRTPRGADSARAHAARAWALTDHDLAPALEWLSAAIESGDLEGEIEARRALSERLPAELGGALEASAALVSLLSGQGPTAPLLSEQPAAKLANLELAPPGGDPRRRAHALLEAAPHLGDETVGLTNALAGYNQLAYGDAAHALQSFRRVVEAQPEELLGWEGLRSAAEAVGDRNVLAEACAALGDRVSDPALGSEFWEQAALIWLDEFKDRTRGEFALSRAVERDVRRFSAFDRLFRIVRERKDGPRLLDLVTRRLEVAEEPEEIAKLFWERARVLRGAGDRESALSALENVRLLEPDHVGALALSGEIYITLGRFAEAAENLARLSALDEAPAQQRLMSGIAAVDLYENKLDDAYAALDVLTELHASGLSTLPIRERLARAAARTEAWEQATGVLETLMTERETSAGRAEAARLSLVICRDRLGDKARARAATIQLLRESPEDGEALDLLLEDVFPRKDTVPLLQQGLAHLTEHVMQNPLDTEQVERLTRIAAYLGHAPLRQAALGALIALGVSSETVEQELSRIDQRVANVPRMAIDASALPNLADPQDRGPIAELMQVMASTICEELGPSLAAFGVSKKERVDARLGLPVRNEVAAWAGALGVGEFELYVGGRDADLVVAIPTEPPAILLGSGVIAPLSPRHRQAVARELFALRRGTTVLRHREAVEIGALVVAACRVVDVTLPAPAYAMLPEFQRALANPPRKVKKQLVELARAVLQSGQDPIAWSRAAVSSLDRMAAIAAGDVSWVLAAGSRERGVIGLSNEASARAKRLLSFVLSPAYLELREQLGMGVK